MSNRRQRPASETLHSRRLSHCKKTAPLFDHLVGNGWQKRWNREAERFGGLQVDHQLYLGRLLDGQIGQLLALEV
jgi:hypothetical protein